MQKHLPLDTYILINRKDCQFYNKIGKIKHRNGEYYTIKCEGVEIELYLCEFEELKNETI